MTFFSKIHSNYQITCRQTSDNIETKPEVRYQYYVDFKGFPSHGKKGKYIQWLFDKKDLKKILAGWDKVAIWIQAGKAAKDTAIVKKQASVPLRDYLGQTPDQNTNVLYHGVGKDFAGQKDLMAKYLDVDIYDPFFKDLKEYSPEHQETIKGLNVPFNKNTAKITKTRPEERTGNQNKKYGHIHSHYTLNVVTKEKGKEIIQHIYDLLSNEGKTVISVRRDIDLVGKIDPNIRKKLNI